jgi:hypothetical protein
VKFSRKAPVGARACHTPKIRKERTEGQRLALEKARQKAMAVRAESAALRKKEAEVERAFAAKARADHAARVEAEFQALSNHEPHEEEGETELDRAPEPAPTRRRKPARRVIVTEASSASESENEVEVVLPRARKQPTAEQLRHQRSLAKMFEY